MMSEGWSLHLKSNHVVVIFSLFFFAPIWPTIDSFSEEIKREIIIQFDSPTFAVCEFVRMFSVIWNSVEIFFTVSFRSASLASELPLPPARLPINSILSSLIETYTE